MVGEPEGAHFRLTAWSVRRGGVAWTWGKRAWTGTPRWGGRRCWAGEAHRAEEGREVCLTWGALRWQLVLCQGIVARILSDWNRVLLQVDVSRSRAGLAWMCQGGLSS